VKADVRDGTAITRAVREASPKRVFHLPAQASVARSGRDPGFDAAVNVGKTVNLLEAARCAGADVVGHEDGHELGPRSPHSGIQRASEPATLVDDQIHARVTQDIAQQVLEARPLSVLDDHQRVPVRRRLVHVGAEGRAQKARVVEPSGAAGWSGGATSASAASV